MDNKGKYAKRFVAVKKNRDFQYMFKKGECISTSAFVCYRKKTNRNINRVGIVTSKKLGNAVVRNRTRRVIREAYRLFEPFFKANNTAHYDFIFVGRAKTATLKSTFVESLMERFLCKAEIKNVKKVPDART